MPSKRAKVVTYETARAIALGLPGVAESITWKAPALKVGGKLMACVPINKQAEPESLAVRIAMERRDELVEHAPDIYYAPPHYQPYPMVLVRLAKISEEALRDLLAAAHGFVTAKAGRRTKR